nr:DUF535 family protein [Mucilaginibacter sp. SP1R1]
MNLMVQNIIKIVRRLLFSGSAYVNINQQLKVIDVLKPFIQDKYIHYRIYVIYLFSYLSRAFDTDTKRQILINHYQLLQDRFPPAQLNKLFKSGIVCYSDNCGSNHYELILASSATLEFEGSLSLFFTMNEIKISTLSFTIAPGKLFGLADDHVIYISRLQRAGNHNQNIHTAIKYFNDIIPSVILMKVLEAVAAALHIHTCIGISSDNQLSTYMEPEAEKFYSIYDQFWINNGATLKNGNYIIPLPIAQKPLELIKQTHRNRAIKKRNKLCCIYNISYQNILTAL